MYARLSIGILLASLVPFVVFAAPRTFAELAAYLGSIMNSAIGVLITAALVFYFWGAAQHLLKMERGEGASPEFRKFLLMGVLVIFVMVSVWGILEILRNTFLTGGGDVMPIYDGRGGPVFAPPDLE
jgi:hypothetical protein